MYNKYDEKICVRSYSSGDEYQIIDLLNKSYGNWGNIKQWKWKYNDFYKFSNEDVIVVEIDGRIVGHRGLIFRDIILPSEKKLLTASIGDTAVDPEYRGYGIYKIMHNATIELAKSKQANIIFSWNSSGSVTYNHNLKTGFIDLKLPLYVKLINPKKFIQLQFKNDVIRCKKFSKILYYFGPYIYIITDNDKFCIIDTPAENHATHKCMHIEICINPQGFNTFLYFKGSNLIRTVYHLFHLLLSGNLKIKFVR